MVIKMETSKHANVSLLGIICDREKLQKLLAQMEGKKVFFSLALLGKGTATSRMLNYLGIGHTEKAMLLSFLPTEVARVAITRLDEELEFKKPGHGVAFMAPIHEGCYHKIVHLDAADKEGEAQKMNNATTHDVIMVVLNRGYTEEVMDAARGAGATGGTVLHARGCGLAGAEKFFGVTIQPEKEVIMVLATVETSCGIMQAIADVHGPGTDANAVSFSMPASHVKGIDSDVPEEMH